MTLRCQRALWFCGITILVGCAQKEYPAYSPQQANWLKADPEAANRATEAANPRIEPRTYFAAGQLFEQQGEIHKAVAQYRKAVVATPDYVPAYNRLGVLLGRLGQHHDAEQALRKAIELRPDWAFLHNNLGFEYMLLARWADAEDELRTAVQLKPDFVRAHNNLAMVLFKMGRLEESLSEFQEAVPQADAYYNLGLMFRGQQRYRDAANAFEHVLALAPNFHAAKTQLAQLAPRLETESEPEPAANPETDPETARAAGFNPRGLGAAGLNPHGLAQAAALTGMPEETITVGEAEPQPVPDLLVAQTPPFSIDSPEAISEECGVTFVQPLSEFDGLAEEPCEENPADALEARPDEAEDSSLPCPMDDALLAGGEVELPLPVNPAAVWGFVEVDEVNGLPPLPPLVP